MYFVQVDHGDSEVKHARDEGIQACARISSPCQFLFVLLIDSPMRRMIFRNFRIVEPAPSEEYVASVCAGRRSRWICCSAVGAHRMQEA
jgi:hypothetical protein